MGNRAAERGESEPEKDEENRDKSFCFFFQKEDFLFFDWLLWDIGGRKARSVGGRNVGW
jgi:hypothetical protein